MPQLFRPHADTIARIVLVALVVVPAVTIAAARLVAGSPYVTSRNETTAQPVPFSHAHHVGDLGLDCRNCHESADKARFAGMPATETCMTCHSQIWTNAQMLAPVRASLADGQPLRWHRVHVLPDYVYFDHGSHVRNGIGCSTCHGDVGTMPLMRQVAPLTMGWCLDCHRAPQTHLRPRDAVFDPAWHEGADPLEQGRRLLTEYHISTEHLEDCSKCHR